MNTRVETTLDTEDNQTHVEEFGNIDGKIPPNNFWTLLQRVSGYLPWSKVVPLEKKDHDEVVTIDGKPLPGRRSFNAHVPFRRYDPKYKQMVAKDGTRAVFLNVLPADVEGMSQSMVDDIAEKVTIALDALPGEVNPWVVQVYQNDEDARALIHEIQNYTNEHGKNDAYQKAWLEHLKDHFNVISRRQGVFEDKKGLHWRSRYRRVRMVVYRNKPMKPETINAFLLRLTEALSEAGIQTSRMTGKDVWTWLMPWYSGEQESAYDYMESVGYPEEEELNDELPEHFSLSEACIRGRTIRADAENNLWHIGNRYNRFLTLEPYARIPKTGHWVLEDSESNMTPFDRMPDGVILMYSMAILSPEQVERKLISTETNAVGNGAESARTKKEVRQAYEEMAEDRRFISIYSGIYIDAGTIDELDKRTASAIAAANGAGFDTLEVFGENADVLVLDAYLRGLPMNYDYLLDKNHLHQGSLRMDSHIAKLLPFYTRGRGSVNHGINFNSTGGEPVSFDPLGADRSENAHLFMIGNSGTGKTTTLITMLMYLVAAHNPRLYLITALPTFYLLGDYFKAQGKTVHRVSITENDQPSLPPFANITKAITKASDDGRDYIGEAEYSAKLMITQGDPKEEEDFRAHDKALVNDALLFAAKTVVEEGRSQALTEDIVKALNELSKKTDLYSREECSKLSRFGTIMNLYTSGMEGQLFNRPGEAWPEADITVVEFGVLARTGNEAKLAISLAGLMQMINHIVEKNQRSERNTITVIDEGKAFLKNELTAPILNAIVAMWRTFGAWLWLATQNLAQIPDTSIELITQCEWWFGICLKRSEVDTIDKRGFKELTELQKKLLYKTRKEMDKYSEAGILSNNLNTVVRIVPPPITMALAETEKAQKNHRQKLMDKHNITEIEAVYMRAKEISRERASFEGGNNID